MCAKDVVLLLISVKNMEQWRRERTRLVSLKQEMDKSDARPEGNKF